MKSLADAPFATLGLPVREPQPHADEARRNARLGVMFRRSLASGQVHPLLPVLRLYHGVTAPLQRPARTAPDPAHGAGPGAARDAPRARVAPEALQRAIAGLPSLPRAVHAALAALHDEHAGSAAIADSIEHDQGLAARTLRAANAAFYGASGRVATIRSAITVLGLSTVSALLAAVAVANRFPPGAQTAGFDFRRFWCHSLSSAFIARGLASRVGVAADVAFTAGLLHDVGELVLVSGFPVEHGVARRYARDADIALWAAERAVLGIDHGLAGEMLARHWHLPAAITATIVAHHSCEAEVGDPLALTDLVHVADALAHAIATEDDGGAPQAVPAVAVEVWARLNLTADDCVAVLRASGEAAAALCEVLAP